MDNNKNIQSKNQFDSANNDYLLLPLLNQPPELLSTSLSQLYEQVVSSNNNMPLYKMKLINGGVNVTKSSVRKLRIRYKLYRAKLRRETFFVIHEELFDLFKK